MKAIYKIKNTKNGKEYIGSSVDVERRWGQHQRLLMRGEHNNQHLQNAWEKYGGNKFEFSVIEKIGGKEDLLEREQYYLDKRDPEYNIALDAKAPMKDKHHSKYVRQKIREAREGEKNPFYGHSHSEETKQIMSEQRSGKDNPMYGKDGDVSWGDKISEAKKGEGNHNAILTAKKVKVIKHLLRNNQFTQSEIGDMYGVSRSAIGDISTGKNWSHVSIMGV